MLGPSLSITWHSVPTGETLASAGENSTIQVWNPHTGELLRVLTGHASSARSIVYSPDGECLPVLGVNKITRFVYGMCTLKPPENDHPTSEESG